MTTSVKYDPPIQQVIDRLDHELIGGSSKQLAQELLEILRPMPNLIRRIPEKPIGSAILMTTLDGIHRFPFDIDIEVPLIQGAQTARARCGGVYKTYALGARVLDDKEDDIRLALSDVIWNQLAEDATKGDIILRKYPTFSDELRSGEHTIILTTRYYVREK